MVAKWLKRWTADLSFSPTRQQGFFHLGIYTALALIRIIAQMVLENSHLTSQGLHAVFKCDLLARAG